MSNRLLLYPVGLLFVLVLDVTFFIPRHHAVKGQEKNTKVTLGIILPGSTLLMLPYINNTIANTLTELNANNNPTYEFMKRYSAIEWDLVTTAHVPSPNEIFQCLCTIFMPKEIPVIVFVSNTEMFAADMAATQFFLQLTDYLRIPVIAWTAENSGFTDTKTRNSVILQMAPSIQHQAAAMLDVLRKFDYRIFYVVTSHIAGHRGFVQAIRERMLEVRAEYEFTMLGHETVDASDNADVGRRLLHLKLTATRIILLYSTEIEANVIFAEARQCGLIGSEYLWLVTQSVIGAVPNFNLKPEFSIGLIGVHFDTSINGVPKMVEKAIKIFGNGLELFHKDPLNANQETVMKPNMSCSDDGSSTWHQGAQLYEYMKNVNFTLRARSVDEPEIPVEFNQDGTLKHVTLDVVNLGDNREWQNVGTWIEGNLEIKSIVWPSGGHTPPLGLGVPEKYHLRVSYLEEPPYLSMSPLNKTTGACRPKELVCHIPPAKDGYDPTGVAAQNRSYDQCCSGFTLDILKMLANDLGFTFELNRVADGLFGTEQMNGKWNGLIADLIENKADIVFAALNINEERERAVDFSFPFIETGTAIVVAKRTGIISPKAFLEPFDTASWILILFWVQAAAISIFLFEQLTPDRKPQDTTAASDGNFTLFRTFWLVWAMLFGAAVDVICPRGLTARFVANIWSIFAVVFNAMYTANLAVFMITREEFYNLEGVADVRLTNAMKELVPLRFGTVPFSNTEKMLSMKFPMMSRYMKNFSRPTATEGVAAIKNGQLDAFIYEATVLDYLVGKDDECRMLTVGKWYARSGHAIAFPRSSKHLADFNDRLLFYKSHGEIERLKNFWLTGACHKGKSTKHDLSFSHASLTVDQFISAFLLLGAGILVAAILLAAEKCYDTYMRKRLLNRTRHKCVITPPGQDLALPLTFGQAVNSVQLQTQEKYQTCQNPLCDTMLWQARREMDVFRLKAEALEAELQSHLLSKAVLEPASRAILEQEIDKDTPVVLVTDPTG